LVKVQALIAQAPHEWNLTTRLRLALQSAWPYVHQHCTIQTVRLEVADLMWCKEPAEEGDLERSARSHGVPRAGASGGGDAQGVLERRILQYLCREYARRGDIGWLRRAPAHSFGELRAVATELARFLLTPETYAPAAESETTVTQAAVVESQTFSPSP
jgi:hypothetical protein